MSISVHVRSSDHRNISSYGDASNSIQRIREAAAERTLLKCISKHSDTMFNGNQLRQLLGEIDRLHGVQPGLIGPLDTLRAAAQSALEADGYLWFSGD